MTLTHLLSNNGIMCSPCSYIILSIYFGIFSMSGDETYKRRCHPWSLLIMKTYWSRCWGPKPHNFWIVLFIGPPGPGGVERPEVPPSEVGPLQTIQNTTTGARSNQGNVSVGQCNTGNQCQSISVIRAHKFWWKLTEVWHIS